MAWLHALAKPSAGTVMCKCGLHLMASLWWRNQKETFSAWLTLCERNPLVDGGFPSRRPVAWSLDVFFDLDLNKRFSKQSRCQLFEMPSRPLWRHCNAFDWLNPSVLGKAEGSMQKRHNTSNGVTSLLHWATYVLWSNTCICMSRNIIPIA